jgi:hypothetical protein
MILREDFQCQVNSAHKYNTETHIINLCNSAFILLNSLSLFVAGRKQTKILIAVREVCESSDLLMC